MDSLSAEYVFSSLNFVLHYQRLNHAAIMQKTEIKQHAIEIYQIYT